VQLGGALGDQHGSGGVQGVGDGVLQEDRAAGLQALSVCLLPLPATAAFVHTLATHTALYILIQIIWSKYACFSF